MNLGVKRGEVLLSDYQNSWIEEFNKVKNQILSVTNLKSECIEHIGSTAIPGLKAKPIIDIMIGVDDYKTMQEPFFNALKSIGIYRLRVQKDDEIVLAKFSDETFQTHTHFIHLVNLNNQKWNDLIKFRDRLKLNDELRDAYMDLKEVLSEKYSEDRPKYTEEKEAFIKRVID
ncbi:GrpB family protein [Macrococcus sp. DPC7161]|uniref:GrpB family protein n=1 Tax=Macrococcus sp. DPC7161 TaxID=2507060 RepID=UPI00100B9706|nr:GrpB family protein [Macrococcus sp. DPC7161]RXK17486.1 GrpB family protein [Macrococcus sp. DPC7161]